MNHPTVTGPTRPTLPLLHAGAAPLVFAACTALVWLAGCSDPPEPPPMVAVTGLVVDGPLHGASVCYDLNDNGSCDSGEPGATTDVDGKFRFEVLASDAGRHGVVAQVPATAIDKDSGLAVGAAFTLRAPASGQAGAQEAFVSPVTTAVVDIAADSGSSVTEAAQQVQAALGLSALPLGATLSSANADLMLASRALGALTIQTAQLAASAGVPAAQLPALLRAATTQQLVMVGASLAASSTESAAARAAAAAAAAMASMNLSAATVSAVAQQVAQPAGTPDAPGPFVSVRRFAYSDANNYSYTVFVGDSSQLDANGHYVAHEVRVAQSGGLESPYNRNQIYWTGSEWKPCSGQWQVSTLIRAGSATTPQTSTYCGGSRSESRVAVQDIGGQTLRQVVARLRASPLPDGPASHTDAVTYLPVNWGPNPDSLAADAVFPAGSKSSSRATRVDIGGTDRIELTSKSSVRWPDGVFRQATSLEQYGAMSGDLIDGNAVPGGGNTVFVTDLALATQSDSTLEHFKRYRAGFDLASQRARFYQCDVRRADQANLNCAASGDATVAIQSQGGLRLLRFTSGYPAELRARLAQQRFWAETGGTVFRGLRDLERTRYDQRLNATAWTALRTALNIPAHEAPVQPASSGPFTTLRNFSFSDAANYSLRLFTGDSSVLDANGYFVANEVRRTVSAGVLQPFVRNRLYWNGVAWVTCADDGVGINLVNSRPPLDSRYCEGYLEERVSSIVLTLGGRLMSEVVNDIRAYGSTDNGTPYGGWGPTPSAHPQLASTRFPEGATMEYRGLQTKATPLAIATAAGDQVRVAPSATSTLPFANWAFATTLDETVAAYPGSLAGTALNGNTTLFVWSFTETPASALHTNRVEIRVAFDANGNRARFTRNNRLVSNGNSSNYTPLLDTTYSIETVGGVRLLKFAALPDGFEANYRFQRLYAERNGGVWYAFKDGVAATPNHSIRLNREGSDALRQALGIL